MVVLLLSGLASAAPTVTQKDAHTVHGEVVVDATPATVREHVGDAEWLADIDPSNTTIEVAGQDGDCLIADSKSPNAFKTVRFRVKRCPTDDGVTATLVESDTLDAFSYVWKITDVDGGTHISYDLTIDVGMAPRFIVNREARNSMEALLTKLEDVFDE